MYVCQALGSPSSSVYARYLPCSEELQDSFGCPSPRRLLCLDPKSHFLLMEWPGYHSSTGYVPGPVREQDVSVDQPAVTCPKGAAGAHSWGTCIPKH